MVHDLGDADGCPARHGEHGLVQRTPGGAAEDTGAGPGALGDGHRAAVSDGVRIQRPARKPGIAAVQRVVDGPGTVRIGNGHGKRRRHRSAGVAELRRVNGWIKPAAPQRGNQHVAVAGKQARDDLVLVYPVHVTSANGDVGDGVAPAGGLGDDGHAEGIAQCHPAFKRLGVAECAVGCCMLEGAVSNQHQEIAVLPGRAPDFRDGQCAGGVGAEIWVD